MNINPQPSFGATNAQTLPPSNTPPSPTLPSEHAPTPFWTPESSGYTSRTSTPSHLGGPHTYFPQLVAPYGFLNQPGPNQPAIPALHQPTEAPVVTLRYKNASVSCLPYQLIRAGGRLEELGLDAVAHGASFTYPLDGSSWFQQRSNYQADVFIDVMMLVQNCPLTSVSPKLRLFEMLDLAQDLQLRGIYVQIDRVLRHIPRLQGLRAYQASIDIAKNNLAPAFVALNNATRFDPNDLLAHALLTCAYLEQQDFENANSHARFVCQRSIAKGISLAPPFEGRWPKTFKNLMLDHGLYKQYLKTLGLIKSFQGEVLSSHEA